MTDLQFKVVCSAVDCQIIYRIMVDILRDEFGREEVHDLLKTIAKFAVTKESGSQLTKDEVLGTLRQFRQVRYETLPPVIEA